jgi:hypothetical protein
VRGDGGVLRRDACDACIRQHTSAYVSIRQHTSASVSIRERMLSPDETCWHEMKRTRSAETSAHSRCKKRECECIGVDECVDKS